MKTNIYMAFATLMVITFLGGNAHGQSSLLPTWGDLQNTQNTRINAARIDALTRSSRRSSSDARAVRRQLAGVCTHTIHVEPEGSGEGAEPTTTTIEPTDENPCPAFSALRDRMDSGEFVSAEEFAPFANAVTGLCEVLNPTEAELEDPCPRASRILARIDALEANDQEQDGEIELNLRLINNAHDSRPRAIVQVGGFAASAVDAAIVGGPGFDIGIGCGSDNSCSGRTLFSVYGGTDGDHGAFGASWEISYLLSQRAAMGGAVGYHRDFGDDTPEPHSQTFLFGVALELGLMPDRVLSVFATPGYVYTDDDGVQEGGFGGLFGLRYRP